MKQRFRLYRRRSSGRYYAQDSITNKQESLREHSEAARGGNDYGCFPRRSAARGGATAGGVGGPRASGRFLLRRAFAWGLGGYRSSRRASGPARKSMAFVRRPLVRGQAVGASRDVAGAGDGPKGAIAAVHNERADRAAAAVQAVEEPAAARERQVNGSATRAGAG